MFLLRFSGFPLITLAVHTLSSPPSYEASKRNAESDQPLWSRIGEPANDATTDGTPLGRDPVITFSSSTPTGTPQTSTSSPSPTTTGTNNYIDIVHRWRSQLGLPLFQQDQNLQNNALKTAQDGNGQMVHELNPGSNAQVLAPGMRDAFEEVFVGGWLCERPNFPGLNGICDTMSQGWDHQGQTGHADILLSTVYGKIGCGYAGGIWACDLA